MFGVAALTFMLVAYALEGRDRRMVFAFALGCSLSSAYGFLSGAWPFGIVEGVWTIVALQRGRRSRGVLYSAVSPTDVPGRNTR